MITHIVFSPNGQTLAVAQHFHTALGGVFHDVTLKSSRDAFVFSDVLDLAIVSFPVYSQRIPSPLRAFFSSLQVSRLVLNITYGGISYGNVSREAVRLIKPSQVVGLCVTPVSHSYIDHQVPFRPDAYTSLIKHLKAGNPQAIAVPFRLKNIFSSLFERTRTNYNVKLHIDPQKCTDCHLCQDLCPVAAIDTHYQITNACIRCSRCHHLCPEDAVVMTQSWFLKTYLRHHKQKIAIIIRHGS